MRVAFVTLETTHTNDTRRTRRLERVAKQLTATGEHEVAFCCAQWWGGDVESFEHDGITYHRVTVDASPRKFATRVPFVLRRTDPDLILASYWPPVAAIGAGTGRWFSRVPIVVDWYGDHPIDEPTRSVRTSMRLADRIISPSEYVQTGVRELGAYQESTRIVPESIDMPLVRRVSPTDGPNIVTARRFDEHANIETMLLGLAELRDRDWQAAIIGDGPRRSAYERQAQELRIDDRVTFTGRLSLEERLACYKGAHVFVQTAERCPFANELLRALACGCAGIVDYQAESAAHELVEALNRGFLTTSSEALSEAIVEAAEHEQRTVNERFARYDHETVLETYLELFESLR